MPFQEDFYQFRTNANQPSAVVQTPVFIGTAKQFISIATNDGSSTVGIPDIDSGLNFDLASCSNISSYWNIVGDYSVLTIDPTNTVLFCNTAIQNENIEIGSDQYICFVYDNTTQSVIFTSGLAKATFSASGDIIKTVQTLTLQQPIPTTFDITDSRYSLYVVNVKEYTSVLGDLTFSNPYLIFTPTLNIFNIATNVNGFISSIWSICYDVIDNRYITLNIGDTIPDWLKLNTINKLSITLANHQKLSQTTCTLYSVPAENDENLSLAIQQIKDFDLAYFIVPLFNDGVNASNPITINLLPIPVNPPGPPPSNWTISWDLPPGIEYLPWNSIPLITVSIQDQPVGSTPFYQWICNHAQSWYFVPDANTAPTGNTCQLMRVDTGPLNLSCIVTIDGITQTLTFVALPELGITFTINDGSTLSGNVGDSFTFLPTLNPIIDDPVTYLWDFGDGTTSTLGMPSHAYAYAGDFTVSVMVTVTTTGQTASNYCTGTIIIPIPAGGFNFVDISPDGISILAGFQKPFGATEHLYVSRNAGFAFNKDTNSLSANWDHGKISDGGGLNIVAHASQGMYYTNNSGSTWTQATFNVYAGALVANASLQNLICGDGGSSIFYKSTNYGASWTTHGIGGTVATSPNYMAISDDQTHIYGLTGRDRYLMGSIDSGSSWMHGWSSDILSTPVNLNRVACSSDGENIAVVADDGSIIITHDHFSSMNFTHTVIGNPSLLWTGLTMSSDGTIIYCSQSNGNIYQSTNSGSTWTTLTSAGVYPWTDIKCSADGTRIIASSGMSGSINGHLHLSVDTGTNWELHEALT